MKKTGEFLRKAREEKGLSVHEIGLSLKINPKILKQIEDGDKDNLPAKTFLRGFVQSYALFLKIDPNEVLRIFSDEMGTTKPHQISLTSGPQIKGTSIDIEDPENKDDLGIKRHTGQNFSKEKFEFKNIGIGIVVFVLLLSLIAVRKVVEKYQREAEVDLAKTEENLKSSKLDLPQAPVPSTPIPAAPDLKATTPSTAQTGPTNIPKIDAPAVPAVAGVSNTTAEPPKSTNKVPTPTPNAMTTNPNNPTGPTPALPAHNPGLPTTKPTVVAPLPAPTITPPKAAATNPIPPAPKPTTTATSDDTKKTTVTPPTSTSATKPKPNATDTKPAVTAADRTPPTPKEEPKKPKNIELVIEAFESVEIEMTQSTGKMEKIKMAPSQIQTIKTVSGVKLNISNGGAVNLSVNGKDIGVPGDLGKPKRVSF